MNELLKKIEAAKNGSGNYTILSCNTKGENWNCLGKYDTPMKCFNAWIGFCSSAAIVGEVMEIRFNGMRISLV